MKKGQVTLFIIIGIIIVVVFFFLFYLTQRLTPGEQEIEQLSIAKSKIRSAPLRYYVESCVQKSFEDGLDFISLQGGRIYSNQPFATLLCDKDTCTPTPKGGSIKKTLNNKEYFVNYLVTRNIIHTNLGYNKFPKSECRNNMSWPYCNYTYDSTLAVEPRLAQNNMPPLKASAGSIEVQLETYIAGMINDCIDFGEITNVTGIPYNIQEGDAEVDIAFTSQDTRIVVDLPLQVTGAGLQTMTEMEHFEIVSKIKYEYFHTFIFNLINKDITDLKFDIVNDYTNLETYWSGYTVQVERDTEGKAGDDLIIVKDDNSMLNDKKLTFQFVRENMPPVLEYVQGANSAPNYDIIWYFPSGQTIAQKTVSPSAVDMNEDEGNFTFNYIDWGKTYFEKYVGGSLRKLLPGPGEGWQYNPLNGQATILINMSRDTNPKAHNFSIEVNDGHMKDEQKVRTWIMPTQVSPGPASS